MNGLAQVTHTAGTVTFTGGWKVHAGGTLTVFNGGTWDAEGLPLNIDGGTVEIKDKCVALFGDNRVNVPPPGGFAITQTAGTIKLHSGATIGANLVTSQGTSLQGGNLTIISDSPVGDTDPAKLKGNMVFAGGVISVDGPCWTFEVSGNVTWTGGSWKPKVDAAAGGTADLWHITGVLYLPATTTAKIEPSTTNYASPPGLRADFYRVVVRADGGFQASAPGQQRGTPTLVNQTGGPNYALSIDNPVPGGPNQDYDLVPA